MNTTRDEGTPDVQKRQQKWKIRRERICRRFSRHREKRQENRVKRGIPDADAVTFVGHSGIESSSPDKSYADAKSDVGNASSDVFFSTSVVRRDTLSQHILCILVPTFHCVENFFLYIFKIFNF